MLTAEDNEIISHVGPGTLMGNLMRRYWTPALLSEEVPTPDCNPVKVRILGEDLVAFRDSSGNVGLMDACCPHRGSGMFFGRNEENGLRCVYHGWKFDYTGQCTDMPSEPPDSNYKDRLKIPAYPTHESGGIVWAYMGPKDKKPGFRDFGTENLPREKWRASKRLQPMTFMQLVEGSYDTTHPSWLHMFGAAKDIKDDGSDTPGAYNSGMALWKFWWYDRAPRVEVTEAWHGMRGAGLRITPNGNIHCRLYHFCLPYGVGGFKVPIDDDTTWNFSFDTVHTETQSQLHVGSDVQKYGLNFPGWPYDQDGLERTLENDYLIDRESQRNGTIYTGILGSFNNQDVMARQTSYTDRTKEHLGTLDRKIILIRRLLINAAKNLAKGIEPPALDPSLPYDKIEAPDQVLMPGQDWTVLGTEQDPNYHRLWADTSQVAAPPTIAR
jgi:nitrite reductase/ring-hydroxylating ferredoxin subunit